MRTTTSKRAGLPGVKMLIAAASIAATLGGWAVLTSKEADHPQAMTPVAAPEPAAAAQPLSRSQTAFRPLRRVTAPSPIAITRSSR